MPTRKDREKQATFLDSRSLETGWELLSNFAFPVLEYNASGQVRRSNEHAPGTLDAGKHNLTCSIRMPAGSDGAFLVISQATEGGGSLELHVPVVERLVRDSLTGLYLRDIFEQMVERQIAFLQREGLGYSVILFDLDHFKSINDTYGHTVGDQVLEAVGGQTLFCKRDGDSAGRWGGEEFCVFLPGTDVDGALVQARRLAKLISDIRIPLHKSVLQPSASFGVAACDGNEALDSAVARADQALYQAKRTQRGSIQVAHPP